MLNNLHQYFVPYFELISLEKCLRLIMISQFEDKSENSDLS